MKLSAKCLLFDYGGTIDTNGIHWGEVIWQAYGEVHVPVSYAEFRDAYEQVERTLGNQPIIQHSDTFHDVLELKIKRQFEVLGFTDIVTAKIIAMSCYEKTVTHSRRASMVLSQLKEHYALGLVSNFYGNLQTVLREFHLSGYFQAVIESAGVGFRKPELEIFKIAFKKMRVEPDDVIIIGDSYKNDIQPANRLGCKSIWLRVKGWHSNDESIEHPYVIQDIEELTALLI